MAPKLRTSVDTTEFFYVLLSNRLESKPIYMLYNGVGDKFMNEGLMQEIKAKIKKILLVRITYNYLISESSDFISLNPGSDYKLIPITTLNYHRVRDFREENRILQYKDKLDQGEIGYFAEFGSKVIGSIWATVNREEVPTVVRTVIRLMPNEGLIHDIVTGKESRGKGVGPFMTSRFLSILLEEHKLARILIDVKVKNRASLRMMEKIGLKIDHKMLYVAIFGNLALQFLLKKYAK